MNSPIKSRFKGSQDPWGRRRAPEIIKRDIDDGDELQRLLSDTVDCTITNFVITFRLKGGKYIEITGSHEMGEVFVTLIEAKRRELERERIARKMLSEIRSMIYSRYDPDQREQR